MREVFGHKLHVLAELGWLVHQGGEPGASFCEPFLVRIVSIEVFLFEDEKEGCFHLQNLPLQSCHICFPTINEALQSEEELVHLNTELEEESLDGHLI